MGITSIILVGFLKDDRLPSSRWASTGNGYGMGDFFYPPGGDGFGVAFSVIGFGDGAWGQDDGDGGSSIHERILNEQR